MKKRILIIASFVFTALGIMALYICASGNVRLTVNVISDDDPSGSVSIYVDDVYKADAPFDGYISRNSKIRLVSDSNDGFMFFSYDNGNTMGESGEYSFILSSVTTVNVWYKSKNSDTVRIIYRNTNDAAQVLSSVVHNVDGIETAFTEHSILSAARFGYDFVSWNKTVSEIIADVKDGARTIIVSPVYEPTENTYKINVVNGSIVSENISNGYFTANTEVRISADAPQSGKKFIYWTNRNGDVISDSENINVTVAGDETYRANYADEDETVTLVPSVGISAYYDRSADKIVSNATRFLPDGYEFISYGLIYVKDSEKTESEMEIEDVDGTSVKSTQLTELSGKSGVVINRISCEDFVCMRSYMICSDSSNVKHTFYSDVCKCSKTKTENLTYALTFESTALPSGIKLHGDSSISGGVLNTGSGCLSIPFDLSSCDGVILSEHIKLNALSESEMILVSANGHFKEADSGDGLTVDWSELIGTAEITSSSENIVSVNANGNLCFYDYDNNFSIITSTKITAGTEYELKLEYDFVYKKMTLYLDGKLVASAYYSYSDEEAEDFVFDISGGCTVDDVKLLTVDRTSANINCYVDGEKTSSVPAKGNYVVYVSDAYGVTHNLWDYNLWSLKQSDSRQYNIYFYSVSELYDSYQDMMSASKTSGAIVGTRSYYKNTGRGAAIYEVTGSSVELSPFFVGSDSIITVDMFGAYADGMNDDSAAINSAFAFADANVVTFEAENYLQKSRIILGRGGITVSGNGANISNSYTNGVVNDDFCISGKSATDPIKNIIIEDLTLTCTESRGAGTLYNNADHVQLKGENAHNVTVRNCRFVVPRADGVEKHVDSIWFNEGISEILIEGCVIKNYSYSNKYSGGIWISAGEGQTAKNIRVINNYIEKSSHDEALSFFKGTITDILVEGNTIYTHDEPIGNPSDHAVGFGAYDVVTKISDAVFRNNRLDVVSRKDAIMFSDVDGIKIYDNEITLRNNSSSDPVEYAVFRVTANYTASQENVEIYGNKVTVENTDSGVIASLIYDTGSGFNIHDNMFIMNTNVNTIADGKNKGATFEDNIVIFNKKIVNKQGYDSSNKFIVK